MNRNFPLAATVILLCVSPGAAQMNTERFKPLSLEEMTPDQKRVAEGIVSGPRKGMRGPFNALLRSPELADRAQKLGEYVRFNTSIPPRLNELAILLTARRGRRGSSKARQTLAERDLPATARWAACTILHATLGPNRCPENRAAASICDRRNFRSAGWRRPNPSSRIEVSRWMHVDNSV